MVSFYLFLSLFFLWIFRILSSRLSSLKNETDLFIFIQKEGPALFSSFFYLGYSVLFFILIWVGFDYHTTQETMISISPLFLKWSIRRLLFFGFSLLFGYKFLLLRHFIRIVSLELGWEAKDYPNMLHVFPEKSPSHQSFMRGWTPEITDGSGSPAPDQATDSRSRRQIPLGPRSEGGQVGMPGERVRSRSPVDLSSPSGPAGQNLPESLFTESDPRDLCALEVIQTPIDFSYLSEEKKYYYGYYAKNYFSYLGTSKIFIELIKKDFIDRMGPEEGSDPKDWHCNAIFGHIYNRCEMVIPNPLPVGYYYTASEEAQKVEYMENFRIEKMLEIPDEVFHKRYREILEAYKRAEYKIAEKYTPFDMQKYFWGTFCIQHLNHNFKYGIIHAAKEYNTHPYQLLMGSFDPEQVSARIFYHAFAAHDEKYRTCNYLILRCSADPVLSQNIDLIREKAKNLKIRGHRWTYLGRPMAIRGIESWFFQTEDGRAIENPRKFIGQDSLTDEEAGAIAKYITVDWNRQAFPKHDK